MLTWRETVAPGEEARFNAYATELRDLARRRAAGAKSERALHLKSHLGVVGKLIVGELPPELRVGPFAAPRDYPLYARFSNGTFSRQHDGVPDIRGVALKLVGVAGKKLIPGMEAKSTQDFLVIQTPSVATGNPDDFMTLVRAAAKGMGPLLLPRLIMGLGLGGTLSVVRSLKNMPKVASMATGTFYSAVPIRFGEQAVKLGLFPLAAAEPGAPAAGPGKLRDDLLARLRAGPVEYSLRVQLFLDEATTPIEDASVRWPEEKAPFREVGRVVLPRQDPGSARGQEIEALVETLSFDPWHAVEELRPLGAIQRARSAAYRESTLERKAADEPETVLEPG